MRLNNMRLERVWGNLATSMQTLTKSSIPLVDVQLHIPCICCCAVFCMHVVAFRTETVHVD